MKAILGKLNNQWLPTLAKSAVPFCSHVDAAVAYVTQKDHLFFEVCKEHCLRLTLYGLLDDRGAVGSAVLQELLAWGPSRATPMLVKGNFHSKVIWWRGYGAYIGSANLTLKAWYNNIEAGIFYTEDELKEHGIGNDLEGLFEYLAENSIPVTNEIVKNLQQLEKTRQHSANKEREDEIESEFDRLFGNLADHKGPTTKPPKGQRENRAARRFIQEWMQTLQLMRGLRAEFVDLKLRPIWIDEDAHPAVHFDQFLHAYYYDYVRGGEGITDKDDDDDSSGLDKVEASFRANRRDPAAALKKAARWWASLPKDCYGEEEFIRATAPQMRARLSHASVKRMDLQAFRDAFVSVNAFRMHARQVKKIDLGLSPGHTESIDVRVTRLCELLWNEPSKGGKAVREVLEFVLWGTKPAGMEERLWIATHDDEYRLRHFGKSSLGEAIGWARPDEFPPRNNRTNKALRSLGHDVKLFSKS